jgi:hypothetical protein
VLAEGAAKSRADIVRSTIDRRGFFGFIGTAALLTACHSSTAAPSKNSSRVSTVAAPSPTSSASSASSNPASAVAHIGGADVPAGQALDVADAKRPAPLWRSCSARTNGRRRVRSSAG